MPRASHSPAAEPRVKRVRRLSSEEERDRQAEMSYYGQSPVSLASQGSWHADVDHGTLGERPSPAGMLYRPPPRPAVRLPPPRSAVLCPACLPSPSQTPSLAVQTGRSETPCVCVCVDVCACGACRPLTKRPSATAGAALPLVRTPSSESSGQEHRPAGSPQHREGNGRVPTAPLGVPLVGGRVAPLTIHTARERRDAGLTHGHGGRVAPLTIHSQGAREQADIRLYMTAQPTISTNFQRN